MSQFFLHPKTCIPAPCDRNQQNPKSFLQHSGVDSSTMDVKKSEAKDPKESKVKEVKETKEGKESKDLKVSRLF